MVSVCRSLLLVPILAAGGLLGIAGTRGSSKGGSHRVFLRTGAGSIPSSAPTVRLAAYASSPGELQILDKQGKPAGLCPLKHTDVSADLSGFVARVTVKQEFVNPSSEAVEAVYTFPLPDDAAVDDMTMTIGDRVIVGEIKRCEEARQIYESARANGQATALLDQERPNIFTQSVANVMPGAPVTITIRYAHLLKYDDGSYEFHFPMVVGPRYLPNGGGYTVPGKRGDPSPVPGFGGPSVPEFGGPPAPFDGPGRVPPLGKPWRGRPMPIPPATPPRIVPAGESTGSGPADVSSTTESDRTAPTVTDADRITPPITPPGTRAGHDLSLTVRLDAGLPLQDVRSMLHPVDVTRLDANRAVVRLRDEATLPNKDFILRYTVAGPQIQEGLLAHADGSGKGYFTLILQPPMAPPRQAVSPKEMVFVIDQTGSQAGWPLEKAKETMRYCIRNMNPDDTFQLLGFNTELFPCFPSPVHNTAANVEKAMRFLAPIEGNGGTDIMKSVEYALQLPDDPDRLRIVCYMTDGYVGNDMQILDCIRKHRGRTRMFPFGIGNSVNRFLIDGMASEGRGAAEYVTLDTPGQVAAERFYRRISSPLLLDVHVDWNGLPVEEVYPKQIPDLFTAGPLLLKGRFTAPAEGDVVVSGLLRGRPWKRRVHLVLPAYENEGAALPSLWAREKIQDLQSQDWMGAQLGRPDPTLQGKIVETALNFRLMSQYTSFVAVEQRVVNVNGTPKKIDVPVEMPDGVSYNGIFGTGQGIDQPEQYGLRARKSGVLAMSVGRAFGGAVTLEAAPLPSAVAPTSPSPAHAEGGGFGGIIVHRDKEPEPSFVPSESKGQSPRLKIDPALLAEANRSRNGGRIEISILVDSLPKDGLERLKALGFRLKRSNVKKKLLRGSISALRLEDAAALGFVRWIAPVTSARAKR